MRLAALSIVALLIAPLGAHAQSEPPLPGAGPEPVVVTGSVPVAYPGAQPGGDFKPALPAGKGKPTITWTGFQPMPDGSSRVFLQVTSDVAYDVGDGAGAVELKIHGARVQLTNNRRPIDTHFFNTPINRVTVKKHGKIVVVRMELRAQATPSVRTEKDANGYTYVIAEFPAGSYGGATAEAPAAPATQAAPPAGVELVPTSAPSDDQATDTERPPEFNAKGGVKASGNLRLGH